MVVPQTGPHMIPRGESIVGKAHYGSQPDKVLQLGNTTVRIFAPKNLSPEEIQRRHIQIHQAIADILRNQAQKDDKTV